jgi:hypothetical protein
MTALAGQSTPPQPPPDAARPQQAHAPGIRDSCLSAVACAVEGGGAAAGLTVFAPWFLPTSGAPAVLSPQWELEQDEVHPLRYMALLPVQRVSADTRFVCSLRSRWPRLEHSPRM